MKVVINIGYTDHCDVRTDSAGFYVACRECPHVSAHVKRKPAALALAREHDAGH